MVKTTNQNMFPYFNSPSYLRIMPLRRYGIHGITCGKKPSIETPSALGFFTQIKKSYLAGGGYGYIISHRIHVCYIYIW